MQSASKLAAVATALVLVACGEPPANRAPTSSSFGPPAAAPPATPPATPTPPSPPPSSLSAGPFAPPGRLGHYSSGDGSVGFVLDRMGPTPKLRLDGTTQIIDFEQDAKTTEHVDFLNRKEHAFLRFDTDGQVTFVRGTKSMDMERDAGADSLRGGPGNAKTYPVSPEASEPNVPKLRLGHYSSGDGMAGFVLDRTGPKPRMRTDDSPTIVELETEPAPLEATSYRLPGRGYVLRVGARGQVEYFRGNESIRMRRDCDADPLR